MKLKFGCWIELLEVLKVFKQERFIFGLCQGEAEEFFCFQTIVCEFGRSFAGI